MVLVAIAVQIQVAAVQHMLHALIQIVLAPVMLLVHIKVVEHAVLAISAEEHVGQVLAVLDLL